MTQFLSAKCCSSHHHLTEISLLWLHGRIEVDLVKLQSLKLQFELCDLDISGTEGQPSCKESMTVNDLTDSKVTFHTLSIFIPQGELWLMLREFNSVDWIQVAIVMRSEENFIECYYLLIWAAVYEPETFNEALSICYHPMCVFCFQDSPVNLLWSSRS